MPPLAPDELIALMACDKKARESGLTWVLPVAPGQGRMVDGIGMDVIAAELQSFMADRV
jgi:3-dehydroquinate synthetase